MKFMYSYPEKHGAAGNMLDAGAIDEVARSVEDSGLHGLAFTEHPAPGARWLEAGGHQSLDPFVALGAAAAVTERIKLLTYLAVVPYRNPFLLAKAAATVDIVSRGRLILGVGTGYLKSEFKALGVDFDERNARFDESLDAIRAHWSGQPFDFVGASFEARNVIARPVPFQERIPVWIGGNAAVTRRRVAAKAEGWMPLNVRPGASQTVRTPVVHDLTELAEMIAEIKDQSSSRSVDVDVLYQYLDESFVADPTKDAARHRNALAELEGIGVTWILVTSASSSLRSTGNFLSAFADTYLS
jgi:probable F420-dependent oxidoreductase